MSVNFYNISLDKTSDSVQWIFPTGEYEPEYFSLTIYTKETVWDSIYVNGIGQQVNFQSGNYYYKWYAKDKGFPVMQINKGILEKRSDFQIAWFYYEKRYNAGVRNINLPHSGAMVVPNPVTQETKMYAYYLRCDI